MAPPSGPTAPVPDNSLPAHALANQTLADDALGDDALGVDASQEPELRQATISPAQHGLRLDKALVRWRQSSHAAGCSS